MPIDHEALAAYPRVGFRLTAPRGAKTLTFSAVLDDIAEASFKVTLAMRASSATVTFDLSTIANVQALLGALDRYFGQPVASYQGQPRPAKFRAALWTDPDDALLMTKLFMTDAELYFDVDPDKRIGWFRKKGLGDELVTTLFANQLDVTRAHE